MQFRHEWKHTLNYMDMCILRARLCAVMERDRHAVDGKYFIRSLYFDTPTDRALREKQDGVNIREKFRIRYYNGDTSLLHLEKKSKWGGLGNKQSVSITADEARAIGRGELDRIRDPSRPLLFELYRKMRTEGLRPRTVVDYTREPFVFAPGNVRVTLDYHIRTGLFRTDFLDTAFPTVPVEDDPIILEVKWDEFLPSIIRDTVNIDGRRTSAYSKYAACRRYD